MPLFDSLFALQIPVRMERIQISFFINQNLYTVSSEANSVPHNHHDFELRFVSTGSCAQYIDGKKYHIEAGKCLITHPFEYHWQSWDPSGADSTQYNLRFSLKAPPNNARLAMEAYQKFISFLEGVRVVDMEPDGLTPLFRLLANEIYQKKAGFACAIQALCTQIMLELIRCSGTETNLFLYDEVKYFNYERACIDHFFQSKFLTGTSSKELAEEIHVSVRQINNLMHRMYQMSFVEKLTDMRLQLAITQLIYTDKSISDIAHSCAFQNQNYFSKCFRKAFGQTPMEYRKSNRKAP